MQDLILYQCIHKRLIEKVGENRDCSRKNFEIIISKLYHVPKKLIIIILKEMEDLEMLEQTTRDTIKILPQQTDPLINANNLYQRWGIF